MHGFVLVALLFIIRHQTNNSIGKVGKAILHLHNRERSYTFSGKELQNTVERKDNLTNTTQTVFQKISIVQHLYMHHQPSLEFKGIGK